MPKLTEVYEEKQGRPQSRRVEDLEKRQIFIPPGITLPGVNFGELRLIPKASSSGAEGTMFYSSADQHLWVATVTP